MADINRKTLNYRFPQPTDQLTPAGQVLGGTVTIEFGFEAGTTPDGEDQLELSSLELDVFTATRTTQNDKFQLTFPGPADAVVAAAPFNGDVNAFLTDYFANDATGQALAALGFDASYRGDANRGVWSITIPGDATDTLPIVDGTGTTILPEGVVDIFVEVQATDGTDTYRWGDMDSAFDVLRRFSHVVPALRDVDANGTDEPVRVLDGTDPNAEVVLLLRPLGPEGVARTNELIRTGTGTTDEDKLLSFGEGQLVYGRFIRTLGPVKVAGSPTVVGVPVQGTTPGKKGELWVGDDAGTPKLFVNLDGTPDGWHEVAVTLVT